MSLEQKTISGLNDLMENLSSWVALTNGPPNDELSDVLTLKQLRKLSGAWVEARGSVRAALAALGGLLSARGESVSASYSTSKT